MTVEQNKAIVTRFYEELWNNRDLAVADEIVAPDCVTHQLRSGADCVAAPRGPEAVRHHITEWLNGFPDLSFTVEHMIAETEHVVSCSVMRGTHTGSWLGLAPTGKQLSIRMIVTQRIVSGKIVEDWVLVEALGFFQQIDPQKFILVQKPYMERRSFATFRKLWPEKEVLVTSPQVSFSEYLDRYASKELSSDDVISIMVGDLQDQTILGEGFSDSSGNPA